jgi:hypothetical protein
MDKNFGESELLVTALPMRVTVLRKCRAENSIYVF